MKLTLLAKAAIVACAKNDHWPIGTIASAFGVHRDTIRRTLNEADGGERPKSAHRPSMFTPFVPFILETLDVHPKLQSSVLFGMCKDRGYNGQPDHFRHEVAKIRPRPHAEAFLRLKFFPGEQAQVDWGEFGYITIGQTRYKLYGFVMVLSYSRMVHLEFFVNMKMENFLRAHVAAFEKFGGRPAILLYDNLKSLVTEREGKAILFNAKLLLFAQYYGYEPRPCAPYRGNEKGRVESGVKYAKNNFFIIAKFTDLDDLNRQARKWADKVAQDLWPEDKRKTKGQAYEEEKSALRALPGAPYPLEEMVAVRVPKTPYVRFDRNDYSVPHTYVRRTLTVRADNKQVRIFDGEHLIATHARSFDKAQQIEDPQHIKTLVSYKHEASESRGFSQLTRVVPICQKLLVKAAARNASIAKMTQGLQELCDAHGADKLHEAVEAVLQQGYSTLEAVRSELENIRTKSGKKPPLATNLPEHVRRKDARPFKSGNLSDYDVLGGGQK